MESIILIKDTDIVSVGKESFCNMKDGILYHDAQGSLHIIDFKVCASNFQLENNCSSSNCIGERAIDQGYFLFYTSERKTKVIFQKKYVWNIFQQNLLKGSRRNRFWQLQKMIGETKYVTYDLS